MTTTIGRDNWIDNRFPFHFNAGDIGSLFVNRLFDRLLERHRGRWASLATALEPKPNDAVFRADQLDVASVRMDIGRDLFQRLPDAHFERKRMQSI